MAKSSATPGGVTPRDSKIMFGPETKTIGFHIRVIESVPTYNYTLEIPEQSYDGYVEMRGDVNFRDERIERR
jgi:hypothetical protein